MYRPVLVTPPAIKPVTLAEVKAALDIGYADKDALINGLIAAAASYLDGWTGILGRCLVEQTWRQDFDDCWPCMPIPLFPVTSITGVTYRDPDNVEGTIEPASYSLQANDLGNFARFVSGFSAPALYTERPAVSITYKAGYVNAGSDPNFTSTVPDAIKQAMFLMIRQWFDNPSAVNVGTIVSPMPFAVDALLAPFRRVKF